MHPVLQLADVPRASRATQPFERGRMQALRVDPVLAAERVDEMLREQFDVFRLLAQRGNPQLEDIQPVQQVLPDRPSAASACRF